MDEVMLQTGNWHVSCLPKDGGRLKKLSYAGHNLLTGKPMVFRPPSENYGRYETRPVYGYDDCFPTVDVCRDILRNIDYPDLSYAKIRTCFISKTYVNSLNNH